jgi:hypothetical protein
MEVKSETIDSEYKIPLGLKEKKENDKLKNSSKDNLDKEVLENEIVGISINTSDNDSYFKQGGIVPQHDLVNKDKIKKKIVDAKPTKSIEQKKKYKRKCKATLVTHSQLQKHKQKHIPRLSFSCDLCDKSYSNKRNLDRHYNKHHVKRFENLFIDGIVEKDFVEEEFVNLENLVNEDLLNKDPVIKDPLIKDLVFKDPVIKDLVIKDLVNKDCVSGDLSSKDIASKDLDTGDLVVEDLITEDYNTDDFSNEDIFSKDLEAKDSLNGTIEEKVDLDYINDYESIEISKASNLEMSCSMELDEQSFVVILHVQSNSKEYSLKENTGFIEKALENYINGEVLKCVKDYLQQKEECKEKKLKEERMEEMKKPGLGEKGKTFKILLFSLIVHTF